jgi:hypothetical protein
MPFGVANLCSVAAYVMLSQRVGGLGMPGYDVEAAARRLAEWIARQQESIAEIEATQRDGEEVTLDLHRRLRALHQKHKALLLKAAPYL